MGMVKQLLDVLDAGIHQGHEDSAFSHHGNHTEEVEQLREALEIIKDNIFTGKLMS